VQPEKARDVVVNDPMPPVRQAYRVIPTEVSRRYRATIAEILIWQFQDAAMMRTPLNRTVVSFGLLRLYDKKVFDTHAFKRLVRQQAIVPAFTDNVNRITCLLHCVREGFVA